MQQTVRVTRLLEAGYAEVFFERQSACSGDCHQCGGCGAVKEKLFVRAKNQIGAKPGDRVIIQSDTRSVMISVLCVYLIPMVLFFAGYALGAVLDFMPGLVGGIGFFLGVIPILLRNRYVQQKEECAFQITAFAQES